MHKALTSNSLLFCVCKDITFLSFVYFIAIIHFLYSLTNRLNFYIFSLSSLSEKATAPHSSTLAWKIPWMEEPGGLQSMGSLRVGHDWETSLSLFTFMPWRRKWQPTPVFFLAWRILGTGSLWAAVYGVTPSQTWLKRLSSSFTLKLLYIIFLFYNVRYHWAVHISTGYHLPSSDIIILLYHKFSAYLFLFGRRGD